MLSIKRLKETMIIEKVWIRPIYCSIYVILKAQNPYPFDK